MRYDAIVVGAGPAGSTAAYRLARAGASVLLLDRARFPRDKPCGGGLTLRAVRLLPFPIDAVVEGRIARLEVGLRHRRRFERTSSSLLALMTQRRRLDAYLVEQAVAAGADFREDTKVGDASIDDAFVSVEAGGTQYEASVLIGADGVNGVTARALGRPPADHGVALEGTFPTSGSARVGIATG